MQLVFSQKGYPLGILKICLTNQKKLTWLKDHGDLNGEEGKNPGDEASSI
jgi:hypothetical protein